MIYESYPWKQDLLRRRRLIQKYNRAVLLAEDDDRAYTVIEKAIFYSAFIIRKLIDCKGKVSDEVDKYLLHLKGVRPIKGIDLMHRWPNEDTHDWKHEVAYTKSGADICNWLIHSYIFFFSYDENGVIDSFYVSSDYDRNKILYRIELADWLAYMEFVSSDYGITDEELTALASSMTLEYTTDARLAIPIQNEGIGGSDIDIPFLYVSENDPVYETDLIEIGESVRDDHDWFTVTVNDVNVYDHINVLDSNFILRKDYIDRFSDKNGTLRPYNRTQITWIESEGKQPQKVFCESVSVAKKLYVVTLTMADIKMDEIPEAERDSMLQTCVNSFNLNGYTVENGEIHITFMNAVVNRKPGEYADSNEIVYREYLGDGQWKVAYLVDEDIAEGSLVLNDSIGKVYVKIK